MKVPKARKLPSGSWFVRVMVDGQSYNITRPTEKEAVAAAVAVKAGMLKAKATPRSALTLTKAIDDYLESKSNILSPSTIKGYKVIQRNRFQSLMHTKVSDIDRARFQKAVNEEAKQVSKETKKKLSAKTIKNSALFIQTILSEYAGERVPVSLPQVVGKELPWLSPDQIKTFIQAIHGSPYEIPALLALSSLRQSEIAAVQYKDIDLEKNEIRVSGAVVQGDSGIVRKEENKTASSRRTIRFIIPQLREAIEAKPHQPDDFVYPQYSNVLRLNINRICEANGLPHVGIHGLRRSFASLCYHLGIPEAITMEMGGWEELATMRKIYTKIAEADKLAQAAKFANFFSESAAPEEPPPEG